MNPPFFWSRSSRNTDDEKGVTPTFEDFIMSNAGNITKLLQLASQNDDRAITDLYTLVEEDLKHIARRRKRGVSAEADASTTVLVNDAFVRLVGKQATVWQDRMKFFGYMSRKIHDLLIDELRKQGAEKRGGEAQRVEPPADDEIERSDVTENLDVLIDLQDALDEFHKIAPDDALLFRIRYFLGCTFDEIAEIASISRSEAVRGYERTKLWLRRELKAYNPNE
jgi:RNA polymerase sigma factor (TIGR02999 family)